MKKVLSYIRPFTKEISSKINGILEITWINGKKVLDSHNASYSYGSLQKLLSYGLSKLDFSSHDEILLLGLGGGSILETLRGQYHHHGKITAVEIDQVIIDIAEKEFNISENNDLKIICDDALTYVSQCTYQFELIIIDIFIDNTVPDQFYDIKFWNTLIPLLKPKGNILFNAGINLKEKSKIEVLQQKFNTELSLTQYDYMEGTNTLLLGKKR